MALLDEPLSSRTQRQLQILCMMARGMTRAEVSESLFISPWTVNRDLDRLREDLGAKSPTQALATCFAAGYLVVENDEVVVASAETLELVAA